jgi:predicted nucleic acid-binding protein
LVPIQLTAPAVLVLDSNVVFDWLIFRDPRVSPLAQAITTGRARWLVTDPMRDEVEHVLTRGPFLSWRFDPPAFWRAWSRWAEPVPTPTPSEPGLRCLRCTDPDDQKFIDLALQVGARALLSRDRAVLKLARRATVLGLNIVAPQHWGLPP